MRWPTSELRFSLGQPSNSPLPSPEIAPFAKLVDKGRILKVMVKRRTK